MNITEADATTKLIRALPTGQTDDVEAAVRYLAERAGKPLLLSASHIAAGRPDGAA